MPVRKLSFPVRPLTQGMILLLAFMALPAHGQTNAPPSPTPSPAPESGQQILQEIDRYIEARNLNRAEQLTDSILSVTPENPNILFRKARIHFFRGDLEEADALLFRISLDYPDRVDLKIERARIAVLLNENKAARELWHSVLKSSKADEAQKRQARLALRQIRKNQPVSFGIAAATLFRSNANNGIEVNSLNILPNIVLPVSPDMKPVSGTATRIMPFFAWQQSVSEARSTPSVRIFIDGLVNNISYNDDTLGDYNQTNSTLSAGTEIEWIKNQMKLFYQTSRNATGDETRNTDLINLTITHKRDIRPEDKGFALFNIKAGFGKQLYDRQKERNARLRQIKVGSLLQISPESTLYLILGREDAVADEESWSYIQKERGLLYEKNFNKLTNQLTFYQADISYGQSDDTSARKDKSLYTELSFEHEAFLLLNFPVRLSFAHHKNDSTSPLYQTKDERVELSWYWSF